MQIKMVQEAVRNDTVNRLIGHRKLMPVRTQELGIRDRQPSGVADGFIGDIDANIVTRVLRVRHSINAASTADL